METSHLFFFIYIYFIEKKGEGKGEESSGVAICSGPNPLDFYSIQAANFLHAFPTNWVGSTYPTRQQMDVASIFICFHTFDSYDCLHSGMLKEVKTSRDSYELVMDGKCNGILAQQKRVASC